jgi:putative MATE family efflux protein
MKKGLLTSYIDGITQAEHGEGYLAILRYFLPEFISAFLLYSLPIWMDSYFISQLESTSMYATLGSTNNFIHLILKLAESISVGSVILGGQFNGMRAYKEVGKVLKDIFWITCLVGFCFAFFLYSAAHYIYIWYGVPEEMVSLGIPFLRIRAVSVFFTFLYLALVGFLRGVKNTKTPMITFLIGTLTFIFFDYLLIFGKWGFPRMELQGSALASVIQYVVMFMSALGYILINPIYRKYHIQLWHGIFNIPYAKRLIALSVPVMIDKSIMASCYIWLCKMISPMGSSALASFCILNDMGRCMFLPAMAFAQVITFLVSNDTGIQEWDAIKNNLKKVSFLAALMVFTIFLCFSYNPAAIIQFFDKKGEFTALALYAFPFIGILVFCDLVQLILAGALRGAGNVKVVMYMRLIICFAFFIPVSFLLAQLSINKTLKFILVYGSFYVGNALTSIVYISRFRSEEWKAPALKGSL